MPELPEVQTTVDGLNAEIKGLKILDVWTDYYSSFHLAKQNIKNPTYFKEFKKKIIGGQVAVARRQGKNVLIELSTGDTILIHMKMTGHLLIGHYTFNQKNKTWKPEASDSPLSDPFNRFIHLIFNLSNKKQLAFSDLRTFAKIFLFKTKDAHTITDLQLGPDPLSADFSLKKMKDQLMIRPKGKIKEVLMNQRLIAGIGNIYSDEMLWIANIHPLSIVEKISTIRLQALYRAMQTVLRKGISLGGDSDSDYRNIYGERGKFQGTHNAYRKTNTPCRRPGCKGTIRRLKIGGRSAHFCDTHQKKY